MSTNNYGIIPAAQGKLKSFWAKPEGKLGAVFLAGIAGLSLWGLYLALPFLITIVGNTIELTALCMALFALLYVVLNETFRTVVRNMFQSTMRFFASWYTTVDPIGILQNNLDDMEADKAKLDQTIQRFAGSDERLRTNVDSKTRQIQTLDAQARKADQMAGVEHDAIKRERLTLMAQTNREKMGLLMQAAKQLGDLQKTTGDLLLTFRHWSEISDAKIERTKMRVEILKEQRKDILDAQATLSVGQRILRGKPEQLKMVDMAIEYLADDASRTLGEIREFNRYSDKLMTQIDVENAANADVAMQQIGEFNQKLLTAGQTPAAVDNMVGSGTPIVTATARGADDYKDLLK